MSVRSGRTGKGSSSDGTAATRAHRTLRLPARSTLAVCMLLAATLLTAALHAQTHSPAHAAVHDFERAGAPLGVARADAQIASALRQVSAPRIRQNIESLVKFYNRTTIGSTDTDTPAGTGILAASDWIREQFESYSKACGGCLEVKVDSFVEQPPTGAAAARARLVKPTPMRNVYAILRGTDPAATRRMYLVTGHYDTRETDVMNTHSFAPGANDDSSGTAVSLEAARVLSQLRFPATLVFVCVAGEEQGLNGSRHLARLARAEGWQLEGVLNNDIVGGDTTPGDTLQDKTRVRVFAQGIATNAPLEQIAQMISLGLENDSPSRELARQVLAVGRTYTAAPRASAAAPLRPVMELRLDRFLRGGDHSMFSAEGFPAVRFTEWRENYLHQHQHVRTENGIEYGDLIEFDDFSYIAQVTRLNIATLATLAKSPGVPQNVAVVTTNLDNNTTLKWDPPSSSGTSPVHYEVVWRETAANDWQFAKSVPAANGNSGQQQLMLPVSKDNVFFGVRSCDAAEHCSQAVPPVPERPTRG